MTIESISAIRNSSKKSVFKAEKDFKEPYGVDANSVRCSSTEAR